jgi:Leucine-rich repeat (LRR) protein
MKLKTTYLKVSIVILLFVGITSINCDLLVWNGSPTPDPNILQKKDSLAVRAILDANGLYDKKVRDVIDLQNSMIGTIMLDSLKLTRFILTNDFDSLGYGSGFEIYILNSSIDTLIISDTIHINLAIGVTRTNLKSIPDNISLLKGNLTLRLPENELEFLPSEIMKCNVSYIDVQYNSLCSVSDTLNNWIIKNSRNPDWKSTQTCN